MQDNPSPASGSPAPTPAPAPVAPTDSASSNPSAEDLAKSLAARRASNLALPPAPVVKEKHSPLHAILVSLLILFIIGTAGVYAYFFLYKVSSPEKPLPVADSTPAPSSSDDAPVEPSEKFYSRLTGEEIGSEAENSSPTYCVQVPNGVDGARDQVGLNKAKIIFEAIAEAGITRFAAIFQNPPAVVGPIRSLRIYYLNWDLPFDCTVVHAGGASDAISALRSSGTRELDESTTFMWRSDAYYPSGQTEYRRWNNLFTSGEFLTSFNESRGYLSSDIKSFPRLTPLAAKKNKIDAQSVEKLRIDTAATSDTNALAARVNRITLHFGTIPNFNPVYVYNPETNSYDRSYMTGAPHNAFDCTSTSDCIRVQLSPSVVIAMIVQEKRAAYDNYHEDISSIGAGDAYIFQNGDLILGTWEKSSASAQIIFRDSSGNEVSLIPGQTWISAVPAYGSVEYQ